MPVELDPKWQKDKQPLKAQPYILNLLSFLSPAVKLGVRLTLKLFPRLILESTPNFVSNYYCVWIHRKYY